MQTKLQGARITTAYTTGGQIRLKKWLYFTQQNGPIFRAKTDLSDLQCLLILRYIPIQILVIWHPVGCCDSGLPVPEQVFQKVPEKPIKELNNGDGNKIV